MDQSELGSLGCDVEEDPSYGELMAKEMNQENLQALNN